MGIPKLARHLIQLGLMDEFTKHLNLEAIANEFPLNLSAADLRIIARVADKAAAVMRSEAEEMEGHSRGTA